MSLIPTTIIVKSMKFPTFVAMEFKKNDLEYKKLDMFVFHVLIHSYIEFHKKEL